MAVWAALPTDLGRAQEALAIARGLDDPALVVRTLTACGLLGVYSPELGQPYFAEAIELARGSGDRWTLSLIRSYQTTVSVYAGDPVAAREAGEEGREPCRGAWRHVHIPRLPGVAGFGAGTAG